MSATGAILGGKCYPSQSDALDTYYSGIAPAQTAGSTSYFNQFLKDSGVWKINQYSLASNGTWTLRSTTNAPVPVFPSCDPAQDFTDGVALGWLIATAMVAAAAVILLKRGARGG